MRNLLSGVQQLKTQDILYIFSAYFYGKIKEYIATRVCAITNEKQSMKKTEQAETIRCIKNMAELNVCSRSHEDDSNLLT